MAKIENGLGPVSPLDRALGSGHGPPYKFLTCLSSICLHWGATRHVNGLERDPLLDKDELATDGYGFEPTGCIGWPWLVFFTWTLFLRKWVACISLGRKLDKLVSVG